MGDNLVVRIRLTGVPEMRAAFRRLPKEANRALKDRSNKIATVLAGRIRSSATSSSAQSAAVAKSVKARRDRVPVVVAGGTVRVTHERRSSRGQLPTWASDLLFGANFGANHLKQFRSHRGAGSDDYWFFSTIKRSQSQIDNEWGQAVDDVAQEWGRI